METQDHQIPNLSGHDGHGGVHVCHKCGWPFPNPHPSSKNRKAHKKVCGTIQNYKLDKDTEDKNHEDGYDGEPQSDDNVLKTPSDKGVERTISRRSSSGVGSRSSRSTRSEDEVFTDAVTEFSESPAVVTRQASDGVMQRFYSLQNENEVDDTTTTVENSIAGADNLCTTNLLKESELQTVRSGEDEKDKVEGGMASQDHISTNPSTVSAASTLEIENAFDLNIIQSSEPSSDVDIVSERGTEIISTKDESKLRTSCSGTPEEVAEEISALNDACDEGKGASDDHMASVFADEPVKTSVSEIDGAENKEVRFNVRDTSGKCNVESCNEVDFPGYFYSPVYQCEAMKSSTGDISKSELVGEHESKVGANENVYVLAAPDMLPLEQHPVIGVEDLNQLSSDNDFSEAPVTTAKIVEYSTEVVSHDVSVCSLDDKHEQRRKSDAEQNTFAADHISPAISSNVDDKTFKSEVVQDLKGKNLIDEKGSCSEENKPSTSQEDILPEGAAMDAGDTTSNADSIRSNIEDDGEYFTVMDKDDSKVSVDGLAVGNSVYMKPTLDEIALQDLEHIHIVNSMGKDENIMVKGDIEESSYKETRMDGCVVDNGIDTTLKTDNPDPTVKVNVEEIPESSCEGSDAVNHYSIEKLPEDTSCPTENDRVIQQPNTISATDTIADSGSVTDSLDGNWGSVSVISATSDAFPLSETIPLNHPQALEGEENQKRVPKPGTDNQHSQSQLPVKLEVEIEQMEEASEIHSTNEADRRQKGKEVFEKVDKWETGKQNTPLKFLLGEATARSREESPLHNNHSSSSTCEVIPRTNDDGFSVMGQPEMENAKEEMGNEWKSPARYPVKIKTTEKRRSKSKPYWAQFLCCSSVNAR